MLSPRLMARAPLVTLFRLFGSERRLLAIRELHHHRGSEGQEGLGGIITYIILNYVVLAY
jgi:hypothetical protein